MLDFSMVEKDLADAKYRKSTPRHLLCDIDCEISQFGFFYDYMRRLSYVNSPQKQQGAYKTVKN